MMQRDVHLKPEDILTAFQVKKGDLGKIALVSGDVQRAKMCLERIASPVEKFTFLEYTFWTGSYKGRNITVGNGGFYSPDSAFVTELLCSAGVDVLIRLGSCGVLRKDIHVGDMIVADRAFRGEGTTRYYVDDDFVPEADKGISDRLFVLASEETKTHRGPIWTTDALFIETKEIVNAYIEKGAIAVDMIASSFFTIANLYQKKTAAILTASDNLITGELGFLDPGFMDAQQRMIHIAFRAVEGLNGH